MMLQSNFSATLDRYRAAPAGSVQWLLAGFSRAATVLAGVASAIRRRRLRKRAYSQLMAMDERLLRDIGVMRSDIQAVIANEFCVDGGHTQSQPRRLGAISCPDSATSRV
jgi:uncharacterized protein YjiS (DUF1127 family)